jgi:hypothetical protein
MKATSTVYLMTVLIGFATFAASAADPLNQVQKLQLAQRIQGGDSSAMLEAGSTRDTGFIPALEGFVQDRITEATNELTRWKQVARENPGFVPPFDALTLPTDDRRFENAKTALAKLGVRKYLDEIVEELTTTNSRAFKAEERSNAGSRPPAVPGYQTRSRALEKLGYIADPATIKFIGPLLNDMRNPYPYVPGARDLVVGTRLGEYAVKALRQVVKDGPATDDVTAWQQWWEQNKNKYP